VDRRDLADGPAVENLSRRESLPGPVRFRRTPWAPCDARLSLTPPRIRDRLQGRPGPTLVAASFRASRDRRRCVCDGGADLHRSADSARRGCASHPSGDSACVLPARRLGSEATRYPVDLIGWPCAPASSACSRQLRRLRDQGSCSRSPAPSRTVPFRPRRPGSNLVAAACPPRRRRQTLKELQLPAAALRAMSCQGGCPTVRRFPGADPVLGPECAQNRRRVMARRATCRLRSRGISCSGAACCRHRVRSFLPSSTKRQGDAIAVAAAVRPGLFFELFATVGTARTLRGAGLATHVRESVKKELRRRPSDLIRRGRASSL